MGNALRLLFGSQDDTSVSLSMNGAASGQAKESCEGTVQNWCLNTADYALQTKGVKWDRCMCEKAMQKDVKEVIEMKGNYIKDLGPNSEAAKSRREEAEERGNEREREEALVLTSYDNSSKVPKQGSPGSYVDDPRWTMELTQRVSKHVFVDADRKGAIHRRSKLAHRSFYDVRGKQLNPDFGEVGTVFGFSGRA